MIALACVLGACVDEPLPTESEKARLSLDVASLGQTPYVLDNSLPTPRVSQIRYGLNGHSGTQPPYIDQPPNPDGLSRTFEALRGLGASIYRTDVPLLTDPLVVSRLRNALVRAQSWANPQKVVLVLQHDPAINATITASQADAIGYNYALSVIDSLVRPYASVIAAVELGNEMEVHNIAVLDPLSPGNTPAGYNDALITVYANFYKGMRRAFFNAGAPVSTIPRLAGAASGHTYFLFELLRRAGVTVSANSVDAIAWHWYSNHDTYKYIHRWYFDPISPIASVLSQLRNKYRSGFKLWITEINGEFSGSSGAECPEDLFALTWAPRISDLIKEHTAIPEVQAIIGYEVFDINLGGQGPQARYGFAVSGCQSVGNQIGYKSSGDSIASTFYRLRDLRSVLANAALPLLGGPGTISYYDSVYAYSYTSSASNKEALVAALESGLTRRRWVENMYRTIHRREGDYSGIEFWTGQLQSGARDRHAVEAEAYASDEYWVTNGSSNGAYVFALYRDIQGRAGG
ncbi:MAG: DUF4214 domain-containing protein, partial [Nitrospira sp.]|nr:DUF4214 domain-containing protein [Nitrospira sp.]